MSRYMPKEKAKKILNEYIDCWNIKALPAFMSVPPPEVLLLDAIYVQKKCRRDWGINDPLTKQLPKLIYLAKSLGIYSDDAIKASEVGIRMRGWSGVLTKVGKTNKDYEYKIEYQKVY